VFPLRCPGEEARTTRLHEIPASSVAGPTKISASYPSLNRTFYGSGRLMWGASRPYQTLHDEPLWGMPEDLWSVANQEQ
jgi:hypothetical protein